MKPEEFSGIIYSEQSGGKLDPCAVASGGTLEHVISGLRDQVGRIQSMSGSRMPKFPVILEVRKLVRVEKFRNAQSFRRCC